MRTRIGGLAVLCLAIGCKSFSSPFGRLESAVVNDRYTPSPTRASVQVVRGDTVLAPALSMRLHVGDSIITSRNTRVVLAFAAGYEVILDTSTVLFIDGPTGGQAPLDESGRGAAALELRSRSAAPVGSAMRTVSSAPGITPGGFLLSMPADSNDASLFVRIGRAFIKHFLGKPDTLDTRTPQATLHEEGTEYVVTVDGNVTGLRVITGVVRAEGAGGRWTARYREREGGFLQANAPPRPMRTLRPEEVNTELSWVRRVERITKVVVPPLDGLTQQRASDSLSKVGLRVFALVLHRESEVAEGLVVDQSPAAGQTTAPGGYVTLTLSKGGRKPQCTVPRIVGQREAAALRLLAAANLKGQGTRNSNAVDDIVTSQLVEADKQVDCGSVVRYYWGNIVR